MQDIQKKIAAAVGPQIKPELENIARLERQLSAMAEQEKTFSARLETANQEIKTLEAEIGGLISAFAEPAEIERKNAELRRKKEAAEDLGRNLSEIGPERRAELRRTIADEKRACADRVSILLDGLHSECCTEINRQLRAVLDFQADYMAAAGEFCRAADIPLSRLGGRQYLRTEGRIGARIDSMPGFTTTY
jgi:chromosome segregation ATPase